MFFQNVISEADQYEISNMLSAYKENLKNNDIPKKTHKEYLLESHRKLISSQTQFEPFDPIIFENKMQADLHFYDMIFKDILTEENSQLLNKELRDLYTIVYEIYNHINIKPEFYKNLNETFLLESIDDKETIVKALFDTFLKRNYFDLAPKERADKYQPLCESHSADFVKEQVPTDKAIELGFKTYLMETFLTEIAFPKFVWNRVLALREDEDYRAVFDCEKLDTLVENFIDKMYGVARAASVCI